MDQQVADEEIVGGERGDVDPENARAGGVPLAQRALLPARLVGEPVQAVEDGEAQERHQIDLPFQEG